MGSCIASIGSQVRNGHSFDVHGLHGRHSCKGADGEFAAEGPWTGERKTRAPQIDALVGRVWRKWLILFRLAPPGPAGNTIAYQQPLAAPKNSGRNQVGSFLRKSL